MTQQVDKETVDGVMRVITQGFSPECLERLAKNVPTDLPGISEAERRLLLSRSLEHFYVEFTLRAAGATDSIPQLVGELLKGACDLHTHGGSDPYPRLLLEDEIGIRYTQLGMKAVVIKTMFTPSASRVQLVQKTVDKWAEENGMTPIKIYGSIVLQYSVGGLNPEAVKRCLGFSGFKYVFMPTSDSYWNSKIYYDDQTGRGIKYLDDRGKVVPEMKEILRIIADNDLVLATGHYSSNESIPLIAEALKLGVKKIQVVHPDELSSRWTIKEMQEWARPEIKFELGGIGVLECLPPEGNGWYVRMIKELGADHIVFTSDVGQNTSPPCDQATQYIIKRLLGKGVTPEEMTKILKKNPQEFLGLT